MNTVLLRTATAMFAAAFATLAAAQMRDKDSEAPPKPLRWPLMTS